MCRVVWEGLWHCLGCRTSGLVSVESIWVQGLIIHLKKTSFSQDSWISYWLQLVCPRSPLLSYGFQSSLVFLESYFQGESNAVDIVGWGSLLMENVGNYWNCATQIILEILVHIKSKLLLSRCSPSCLGCPSSILHCWKWSLVWIQGRNMGLVSRILRVWHILLLERACRSEFPL